MAHDYGSSVMQYTNLHTCLNFRPDLNPALLRRIADCRRRSRKARTHAEKIAMAERIEPQARSHS
jgi:hypothetical protein